MVWVGTGSEQLYTIKSERQLSVEIVLFLWRLPDQLVFVCTAIEYYSLQNPKSSAELLP